MNKQNGFTLIELVVVIIILGILAVTAAPKFINLQSDARASTLSGMQGALQGANTLLYSKAAIQGVENEENAAQDSNVDTDRDNTDDTAAVYGYVAGVPAEVIKILDIDTAADGEWTVAAPASGVSSADVIIHPQELTVSADLQCFVEYTQATGPGLQPTYNVVDDDC